MKKNKSILTICILLSVVIVVCLSGTLMGREKHYEIRNEITTPAYRTGIDRMIDAYQQLMDDYIRLTERNLTGLNADVNDVQKKLNDIDSKLTRLSLQLERIEKHLGIEQSKKEKLKTEQTKKNISN